MAMILDAFVSSFADKLAALVEEKVALVLGVKDELKRLQRRMGMIKGVLQDAERRRIQESAIDIWLEELKDIMYDADDIIDICRYEAGNLLEDQSSSPSNPPVCSCFPLLSSCTTIRVRNKIGDRIQRLNNRLEEIRKDEVMLTLVGHTTPPRDHHEARNNARLTSPLLDADVVGDEIEIAAQELVKRILSEDREQHQFLAIVGMGGIGKTTLAQKVYNALKENKSFSINVWVCVSKSYSENELLKEIIRSSGGDYGRAETVAELHQILRGVVGEKRFFLVLDDVWQSEVWHNLLQAPFQSEKGTGRILITARDRNVAKDMRAVHIHQVEHLSINSGWELLSKRAYLDKDEDVLNLKDVGTQIVKKCGGLPLAIRIVASLLARKDKNKREWEKVLKSDAWSMSGLPEELRGALYLSYEDLSPQLKQCFLYCSLYPEDETMLREHLIRFWVAEGFVRVREDNQIMEDTAEEYYNELVRRSLLQLDPEYVDGSRCKMHDLLLSLAQYLSRNESFYGDPQSLDPMTLSKIRRLAIVTEEKTLVITPGLETKKFCLRTLRISGSPHICGNHLFLRLACIRVLDLAASSIESIPESLGDLIHLRLLDLDRTDISNLPDSLGRLTNLQILNLNGCNQLHALPRGLTQLCNLRRLGISGTPLNSVPKGIGRLQSLNDLYGFVVAKDEGVSGEMQDCWDLKELESLNQLRWLTIEKMERANDDGFPVLESKDHLRELMLYCTLQAEEAGQQPYSEEETNKIEEIFQKLCPPPCLEHLEITGFFGRRFPSYMATSLSSLTTLQLFNCISCPHLPPLGQLPELRYLRIEGALAVVTIGLEFLCNSVKTGSAIATVFPKLEFLFFEKMPNWEEWSLGEEIEYEGSGAASVGRKIAPSSSLSLLPRLKKLDITYCPKLRALPERLKQATMLQNLYIVGAHSLRAVENLPSLRLQIFECNSIERVSNLPQLTNLHVVRSRAPSCVQNMDALQSLYLEDELMECLPEWVAGLLQQRQHLSHDDLKFEMFCNIHTLERCQKERQDWPIIQMFSKVTAYTIDRSSYLEYTRSPFSYNSNLPEFRGREEEEKVGGTEERPEVEQAEGSMKKDQKRRRRTKERPEVEQAEGSTKKDQKRRRGNYY